MDRAEQILTLAHWTSPAYPLGSFAWSHGLEAAVAAGRVRDGAALHDWLADVLVDGTGRSDAVLMRVAHGTDDPAGVDAAARAFAPGAERLRESVAQGAAFARATRAAHGIALPDLCLPVAIGRAARLLGIGIDLAVPLWLQGFAANVVGCAQRLIALGQSEAQLVLAALRPLCVRVGDDTRGATLDDLCSNAFLSDVASMRHETLETRLFQS